MIKKFRQCSELNVAYKTGMIKDDDMTIGGCTFDVKAGNLILTRSYEVPEVAKMILQSKSVNFKRKALLTSKLEYTFHTLCAEEDGVPPMILSKLLKSQDGSLNIDNRIKL